MRSTLDTVAAIGLAIGGAFGLAGTFVASDALRETLWTIDGVALVVGTALLTMKYQRLSALTAEYLISSGGSPVSSKLSIAAPLPPEATGPRVKHQPPSAVASRTRSDQPPLACRPSPPQGGRLLARPPAPISTWLSPHPKRGDRAHPSRLDAVRTAALA
ncbi:MAG: hypothetical protein EOS59_18815 [Mesorhizobium sp.]|nr:MAG: hypothetical protein EOS59_18815 [Mesorhizobium sp.]